MHKPALALNMKLDNFTEDELNDFRRAQRISFDSLEKTRERLRPGMTEKEAVDIQRDFLRTAGVSGFFHTPVALFGTRTTLPGDFGFWDFLPTGARLEEGMPVILDQSPILRGYTVDTSYTFALGENPVVDELREALVFMRSFILEQTRKEKTFREIYRLVNKEIRRLGYRNCHRKHPEGVLGHRVTKVPDDFLSRLSFADLSLRQVSYFLLETRRSIRDPRLPSPNWNARQSSNRPPLPGLWAVEPHFSREDVGAKFEEIMVITESDARWLSDDVPHLN